MKKVEIQVPALPESVSDGELVRWRKQVGDFVRRDENLVDLETDKVVLEIPAPADGVLVEIARADGSSVRGGEVIATLDSEAVADDKPKPEPTTEPEPAQAAPVPKPAPTPAARQTGKRADLRGLSPSVRRLVEEHDLDPKAIPALRADGRLTKGDVLGYLAERSNEPLSRVDHDVDEPIVQRQAETPPAPIPVAVRASERERRVPMTKLRRRIAERLVEAQQTTASLTTFNEVNLQKVMDLRARYKDAFEKEYGVRLGFMSFFVKAAVEALHRFPAVNGSIEDDQIVYHDFYDIGIAVASPRGLVVPVLRDADTLSFAGIESRIGEYAKKAKDGSLGLDDLSGGTFTITNGGVFGSMLSTPILNPPQSAILGMHKIEQRAVVEDGQIVARPVMYLALTYDHRIIDGREAVSFLVSIKQALEDPARLLLQI
ncbi:MAG: 2-oxoglutarate dehydrogenase complex dihydrolipoyllysine-residue succinyltransferase [Gammaproteobacteria bacterium]|nr:2-oxoglutarate dehydrogenase complex dihydrolipoyllysine-residue succinyltransferase [Gammaproteobacteria bacterium]